MLSLKCLMLKTCLCSRVNDTSLCLRMCSVEVIPNTVDESSRFNVLHDGTLMIEDARDSDTGVYECVAKNVAGEAKTNAVELKYQGTDSEYHLLSAFGITTGAHRL